MQLVRADPGKSSQLFEDQNAGSEMIVNGAEKPL